MNEQDLADRGLEHGDVVDIQTDLGAEPAPRLGSVRRDQGRERGDRP